MLWHATTSRCEPIITEKHESPQRVRQTVLQWLCPQQIRDARLHHPLYRIPTPCFRACERRHVLASASGVGLHVGCTSPAQFLPARVHMCGAQWQARASLKMLERKSVKLARGVTPCYLPRTSSTAHWGPGHRCVTSESAATSIPKCDPRNSNELRSRPGIGETCRSELSVTTLKQVIPQLSHPGVQIANFPTGGFVITRAFQLAQQANPFR